jgi:hypothetical protein
MRKWLAWMQMHSSLESYVETPNNAKDGADGIYCTSGGACFLDDEWPFGVSTTLANKDLLCCVGGATKQCRLCHSNDPCLFVHHNILTCFFSFGCCRVSLCIRLVTSRHFIIIYQYYHVRQGTQGIHLGGCLQAHNNRQLLVDYRKFQQWYEKVHCVGCCPCKGGAINKRHSFVLTTTY